MQRQSKNRRTAVFVAAISVTLILFSAGPLMSFDSPLIVGWQGEKDPLKFDPISDFLDYQKIAFVIFVNKNGELLVTNAEGREAMPCNLEKPGVLPINCKALTAATTTGFSQTAIAVTTGSPDCVTIIIGGYAIDIDPATRRPCKR